MIEKNKAEGWREPWRGCGDGLCREGHLGAVRGHLSRNLSQVGRVHPGGEASGAEGRAHAKTLVWDCTGCGHGMARRPVRLEQSEEEMEGEEVT